VLRLLSQGLLNKEIAQHLALGEKTIKTHVSHNLVKLGVQSRTQAALAAVRPMRKRVAQLGETLAITSAAGRGVQIRVVIPHQRGRVGTSFSDSNE
jgi:FixJ family two-component response regulator